MTITPIVWLSLTWEERMIVLQYAAWENEKRPKRTAIR